MIIVKVESSGYMKKKGFTLIELLAVIVILAIIALIATPIVMNVIENSRKGAAERSAENLEHSAEIYYYNKKLDGGFPGITFTCKNGSCSSNDETLEISGKAPEAGTVIINKDGTITLSSIVINGYNCYKENESYTCDKITKTTEKTENGMLTIDSKGAELSNYKIYGNSAKVGLNLYQNMTFTDGYILSTDGTPSENANYKVSDYLEVTPNETYISQMMNNYNATTGTPIRCWGYDENKNKISMLFENARFDVGMYENEFTVPENVKYIRISYRITDTGIEFYKKNIVDGESSRIEGIGNKVSIGNQIKYEIPITVTGKNIWTLDENVTLSNGVSYDKDTQVFTMNNSGVLKSIRTFKEPIPVGSNVSVTLKVLEGEFGKGSLIVGGYHFGEKGSFQGYASTGNVNEDLTGKVYTMETVSTTDTITDLVVYIDGSFSVTTPIKFQVQFEFGAPTEYEPYKEETYSIYLDEPLRCVGNACDYIDYISGKVVRNVGVESDGTLVELKESTSQDIDLPNIKLNKGISNIFVETDITPSNIQVEYYK